MHFFRNSSKSVLLIQLMMGIAAILFIITGWIKAFHPGYMLTGIVILAVMMVMNGIEQYFLTKKKGYLLFTIIVALLFTLFWIWRFSLTVS